MAQIAEDLFLLLLDNASAQPGLDRVRRERVLSAAVLLDLAYACRIRPAMAGEPVEPGRLVALAVPGPMDPVVAPAFQLLQRRPLRPATAVKRLSKHTEENRSALLGALFDRRPPTPTTAAIISLLHAVDGLGALLSLNDRGWRWVHARAGEIAMGSWVDEYPTAMPEVNLAITASAVRGALA